LLIVMAVNQTVLASFLSVAAAPHLCRFD